MKKLIILLSILLLSSCRMYERDYLEEVPIPQIEIDTIDTGRWEDPITER